MQDTRDFSAQWSSGTRARSPLLMLGGSVVAAVMLIGTGLSMLGTEPTETRAASAGRLSARFESRPSTQVVTLAELKELQVASAERR